jgi:hypothetical protein
MKHAQAVFESGRQPERDRQPSRSPNFGKGHGDWDCREKLSQAQVLVTGVRDAFLNDGDASGSFLLSEVIAAIADEVAALDKKIVANP